MLNQRFALRGAALLVTTSKALAPRSNALVPSSFLFLFQTSLFCSALRCLFRRSKECLGYAPNLCSNPPPAFCVRCILCAFYTWLMLCCSKKKLQDALLCFCSCPLLTLSPTNMSEVWVLCPKVFLVSSCELVRLVRLLRNDRHTNRRETAILKIRNKHRKT